LRNVARTFAALTLAGALFAVASSALGAPKKDASPGPAASASPAPAPTATPEPPEVAIPRLEAKLKAEPNDKPTLTELSGYYLGVGRPDQALALTQRLLSLGDKSAQTYYLDGLANQSVGHVKEATSDFEQASNLEPTNSQVLLTLTNLYLQTNRADDAERVAKRAITFNPNDKRVFENYGLVLAQGKKYDEARAQFENAAKLDPKDPLPIVLEARAYVDQKAYGLALQDFDRALTVDPNFGDALLGKARLLASQHNVKDAIAAYEQLLAGAPTDDMKAAILIEEYQVYRDEKQQDQALAALKRAVASYPKVPAVHLAYGDYYAGIARDFNSAENEWKIALGPNRDNPDALQRLGDLALSRNKPSDAADDYKRITQLLPGDPGPYIELAQVYAIERQFQAAKDAYGQSFQIARTPAALAGVGASDFQLKNYKECGQIFDAIDKNAGDFIKANPQLFYIMGRCYAGDGDRDKAKSAFTRFKPFVKPGTPLAAEVDKQLSDLNGSRSTPPKPSASPAHHQ
jgi:tetratricopeptide (TPR) repeat protein